MKRSLFLGLALAGILGCATSDNTAAPYENCSAGEGCTQGTACIQSTVGSSYSGYFCSNSCNTSNDCLQDLNNYDAICVNDACYIQCPTGGQTCPYGTQCFAFTDQTGGEVDLCTP